MIEDATGGQMQWLDWLSHMIWFLAVILLIMVNCKRERRNKNK